MMSLADYRNVTREQMGLCGDVPKIAIMKSESGNTHFNRSQFPIADLMQFMKSFIDGESLHRMASNTGMDYTKVSVDWGEFYP